MERTAMSSKEFTRGSVLARVASKEITLKEAVPLLSVSYRQAKRLYQRYRRAGGTKGLVHGNVGRKSNRAHPMAERDEVLSIIRAHYGGSIAKGPGQRFGPTLVAEHLWTDHGVLVPRQTLRDWMRDSGARCAEQRLRRMCDASAWRTLASWCRWTAVSTTGLRGAVHARVSGVA